MAFFGGEDEEIKKLKKQLGAQDLKIGGLESEKTKNLRQIVELQASATELRSKHTVEVERALTAEEALAKLKEESSKKSFQLANLQQALDKAHERESQESKGRRMEEQNRDMAMGRQSQEDHQTIKKLEDKLKTTEAKLKETQEDVRRLEASSASSSRGGRSIDSAAKILSLENEMTVLRAENERLSQAGPSSLRLDAGPSETASQRPRRPRSSSVSGSSPSLTSDATLTRMQAELTDLRRAHTETRTDLDSMTVRAEKAEKDYLKASNEALAHQRRGEKQAEESRAEMNVLKEDLRWKQTECDGLAKDLETCERRVEQLETELEQAQATGATPQADAAGLSAAIQERDQAKQQLQEVRNELAQLQATHDETSEALTTLQASSDSMADEALQRMSELEDALTAKESQISELSLRLKEDHQPKNDDMRQAISDPAQIDEETVAQLTQLRQEISQLEADLSAKDALIEQAEALAEEDARHLRMKEAEVAQLSSELARLRQKAKENAIEIELLRAANDDEDGTGVEGKLDDLRDQLNQRDREAQRLQSLVHSKENELEAGKKQLRKIVSFLTNRGLPANDSLSTPRKVLAEVKVQSTPISKLLKSHHFFATPGGKPMQRGFEEDLLDEIELVRGAIQESEQQQSFLQIERETELRSLKSQAANDASEVQRLQGLLQQAEADCEQLKAQHSADQGQRDAAVDAEQQSLLETQRSRVDELEKGISSLQAQAEETQAIQAESEKAIAAKAAAHEAALAALQAQVDASNDQVAAIASLSERLLEKKQQLGNFEKASHAVTQVERLLSHQDSASQHVEQAVAHGTQHQQQLAELTQAGSSSLADCRTWLAVPKLSQVVDIPALPMLDSSEDAQPLDESAQVSNLRNKIQELEGRVLRREEQIGSHQLKLESLTTKLDMAYDDYEELLEEKVDLEHELVDLKARLDVSIKEHSEISQRLQTELHEANEALQSSTRRLEEEMSKVASLEDRNVELSRSHVDLDLDEAEIADDASVNEELRSELALAQQEVDRLSKDLLSQQEQASMLQQQLDQRAGEFEALQSSHSEVTARLKTLQTTPASSDGGDLTEVHSQIAALEEEIAALKSSQADDLLAEQTRVDALEREVAETVAELQAVSEKLTQADEELSSLRVTLENVEGERDAKAAELASAVEALNGAAGDEQLVATLQQQIKTLELEASTAQNAHTATLQELQTKAAEAAERAQLLEAQESALHIELNDLRRAANEAKTLSEQVSTLEAQRADLQKSYADLEASAAEAEASAQNKYTQVSASLRDLESRLRAVLDDLEEREKALASAESAIKERDEHIQSRNDEFWNLKEEVAELQEAAERSRVASQSVEALESQLRDLEVDNERLLQVQEELKSSQAELVLSQQRREAAERESVLKQAELSDLQTEMKRRKAVNRMNEEENQALKLQVQEAEAAQRNLQMDLAGHEDELNSARLSVDTLNGQITRLQGELATALTTAATGSSSASPDDLLEEVSYLNSRVSELEQELDAKNEEIDTADTRIIASLKENKKLSGKVKALQSQVLTLQQQQQQASSSSTMSMTKVAGNGDASTATKPTSSPILPANNKKRSAPDDAAQPVAPVAARAMYVATSPETSTRSVNKGSFTPVRKVKPLGSPRKAEATMTPGLQDRTNVKSKSQLMDAFAASGKKPIVAAIGEKKAAASGGSNALMAALAAKRKMNTQV